MQKSASVSHTVGESILSTRDMIPHVPIVFAFDARCMYMYSPCWLLVCYYFVVGRDFDPFFSALIRKGRRKKKTIN